MIGIRIDLIEASYKNTDSLHDIYLLIVVRICDIDIYFLKYKDNIKRYDKKYDTV